MSITCFIEYEINPFKHAEFEQYAKNWGEIIPRCGGNLIGYFLPHEGDNKRGYGLITFNNLAEYESYRERLKQDKGAVDNFQCAQKAQFILHEKRYFLKGVPETQKFYSGALK
ncbi:NIPSNAP family protein [Pseudoalteromonas luteoviolacea]|uniref:NIPSNAP family protein n=1 Tax=Pseudoalteromonas luteoviolacea TaxID=43657 RepID=UPI00114F33F4|nr:NIPSNAP family protein [Pseudoalteromonas luteoviolacea]TQF71091.1 NIPSNAP family protein [Pseudoalteromonas luteoviolacea]